MERKTLTYIAVIMLSFFGRVQAQTWGEQAAAPGCIDATDLMAEYTTAYYGTFRNPYQYTGGVNYGQTSGNSRHTVNTNPDATDPRTGNQLRLIPPGATSSVRLGNWTTGAQAEALEYALAVDTLVSDLMILRYAAVLQDPINHAPSEMPRFCLEILDENHQVIDPVCGIYDFIASSELGWNRVENFTEATIWKDWTTVGINLTPYAGQIIHVRLTTYDCRSGSHYGYAYFTLECARKSLLSTYCRVRSSNTFTAPDGFNYRWYIDNPDQFISLDRTITVPGSQDTSYHCLLSSVENPTCTFIMDAYAGTRYPLAGFTPTVSMRDCSFDVSFYNSSAISSDQVTPLDNGEGCETALWDFGDGTTSTQYHATHHYAEPGTYSITLVSGIANDQCLDTMQLELVLALPTSAPPYIEGPTVRCTNTAPDTLWLRNAIWSTWSGNRRIVATPRDEDYTVTARDSAGCETQLTHHISVHPSYRITHADTICDNALPYQYDGHLINSDAGTHSHTYRDTTVHGCDSIHTMQLTVNPTYSIDTSANACGSFQWHGTRHGEGQHTISWSTQTRAGCDSSGTLHLTVHPTYDLHFQDTICDSRLNGGQNGNWQPLGVTFEDTLLTTTGNHEFHFHTAHGCDSVRTLHLLVHHAHDLHFYDTIYDGDTYTFEKQVFDTTGIHAFLFSGQWNCDSLRTLHLQRCRRTYIDSMVCQNDLPLTWMGGVVFTQGKGVYLNGIWVIRDSIHLTAANGNDSLLVMTLVVRDTSFSIDEVRSCDSMIWHHQPDIVHHASTDTAQYHASQTTHADTTGLASLLPPERVSPYTYHLAPYTLLCDSVVHLHLTLEHTQYNTDYRLACDSILWPTNPLSQTTMRHYHTDITGHSGPLGSHRSTGPVDTLTTAGGCDSVVSLNLRIHRSTSSTETDTFCFAQTYTWHDITAGDPDSLLADHAHYTLTKVLQSITFHHPDNPSISLTCDSVAHLQLTQLARPVLTISDSIDCDKARHILTLATNTGYLKWIDTAEHREVEDPVIHATPEHTTLYTAYVDYRREPLCPLTERLRVYPITKPEAQLKVNPEALTYAHLDLEAYDHTPETPGNPHSAIQPVWQRHWNINHELLPTEDPIIYHTADPSDDSVTVTLILFNGQCHDTAEQTLPILRSALFAPNAFTPTQDINNRFLIKGHGILRAHLYIYNREGSLVYQTTDLTEGWDGLSNGRLCPQGSYVWKLIYRAVDLPDRDKTLTGTVLLLR